MASQINASNSGFGGIVSTGDSSGQLQLQTAGTTALTINTSQNVGIGTSSPSETLSVYNATSSNITLTGDSAIQFTARRYSTDTSSSIIDMRKSRGTFASPTAVASGDQAGLLNFGAYGGSNFRGIARINGFVDTYTSDTNISGYLTFLTNGGSTAPTERMRIDSSGNVGIGTASPSSYGKLAVNGSIAPMGAAGTYSIDVTLAGPGTTVSSGGTVDFSNASGMLVVNQYNNGAVTIYLCGGGSTTAVASVAGTVGSFAYNAGIGGYTWTSSTTSTYGFFFLRTRPTA